MPIKIKANELPTLIGRELEPSPWFEIDQDRVDRFADATNDHQYIHVDPGRAAATPFGGTIAHGFLTLSLVSHLIEDTSIQVEDRVMTINYGSDKVRFLQAIPVGSRIRARQVVLDAVEKSPGQWLLKIAVIIDIEHQDKPAMIAEILSMSIIK